ncbi:MAG: hypothetical protein WBE26_14970 [Phycisphaerae bacterium]
MTQRIETWTTEDLELYRDEELDPVRRSELNEALRRDPGLRDRLATVRRVDDMLRSALVDEIPARSSRLRFMLHRSTRVLAAACLLIAVTTALWFAFGHGSAPAIRVAQEEGEIQPGQPAELEYKPIRVVFSLPIRRKTREASNQPALAPDTEERTQLASAAMYGNRDFLVRLHHVLGAGQIDETLGLLNGASDDQRAVAYRHMGEMLRSALVAEQILDRLSSGEQLAVCRQWAREPGLRAVVFTRLRRFSKEPELSDKVQVLVARFARDPVLLPWLRGYQLVSSGAAVEVAPS